MSFQSEVTRFIDNRPLREGQIWPVPAAIDVITQVLCTSVRPDSFDIEVTVGGFSAFKDGSYATYEEARSAAEREPAKRFAALLGRSDS